MSDAPGESWSFDRASEYYDRTRALTPRAEADVIAHLARELQNRGRCLEIGVGTGRIALPLARAGIPLAGVDVSRPMLAKLVEKSGGRPPFPLAVGDAAVLPFAAGSFGAALGCHVLHLIASWEQALRELTRVVRPGGVVLVDLGGWGTGWSAELIERFSDAAGLVRARPGAEDDAQVDAAMEALGATARSLPEVREERSDAPADALRRLEEGLYSFTWQVRPEARTRAAGVARAWAQERWEDLAEPLTDRRAIRWRAYDLPGAVTA